MFRIVKASTLAKLQQAAGENVKLRDDLDKATTSVAAYRQELGIALRDIERRQAVHEDVRRQARDWENAYNATVESVGKWVAQVRAQVDDPVNGTKFQGDLALGLWQAYLAKADEEGDDSTGVLLLKALLGPEKPQVVRDDV